MPVDENEAQVLDQWTHRLAQALQILDLEVDQDILLDLARKSADSVIHAAAPVTTFLVGYAAGLDAGTQGAAGSKASSAAAITKAADVASRLCEDGHDGGPAAKGWADTGQ
ncbi:MAG: molybdopterin-guanine dinucleotide biosynthesis protein [Pseudarthrobacter sp.]|nr:molybdopterin-guanine dinucleotide biosynthesis protein [Pseudarthrobacter sp.]